MLWVRCLDILLCTYYIFNTDVLLSSLLLHTIQTQKATLHKDHYSVLEVYLNKFFLNSEKLFQCLASSQAWKSIQHFSKCIFGRPCLSFQVHECYQVCLVIELTFFLFVWMLSSVCTYRVNILLVCMNVFKFI